MPCERKARYRHNTIAFWLSDEEKSQVEARISISGLQKGEYYRRAILGQRVAVEGNRYQSQRLAWTIEKLYADAAGKGGDTNEYRELICVLEELLKVWRKEENEWSGS